MGMCVWHGLNTSERRAWHPIAAPVTHTAFFFCKHTAPSSNEVQSEMKPGWSVVELPLRKERMLNVSFPQAPGKTIK